jgi:hypothetical protein
MTNQFLGEQHEHKSCAIIFEGTRAFQMIDKFKAGYKKCTTIQDAAINRLIAIIDSANDMSKHYYQLHAASVQTINITKTVEDALLIQIGMKEPEKMQGLAICPGCLQQAILSCEEVLQSLKDIQEVTKEYT